MLSKIDCLEKMKKSQVFKGIPEKALLEIIQLGHVKTLPSGYSLLQAGDRLPFFYFVLSGKLRVFLPKNQHRFNDFHLDELGPGFCIGEYSFVDAKEASASVVTEQETLVLELLKNNFEQYLQENLQIGFLVYKNLLSVLVKRCRDCNEELDIFTSL